MWFTPHLPYHDPHDRWVARRYASAGGMSPSSRPHPTAASISITCAVTSSEGGSSIAPKSAKGSLYTSARVLSLSNAAQAPLRERIALHHRTASATGCATRSGSADSSSASTTTAVSSTSG